MNLVLLRKDYAARCIPAALGISLLISLLGLAALNSSLHFHRSNLDQLDLSGLFWPWLLGGLSVSIIFALVEAIMGERLPACALHLPASYSDWVHTRTVAYLLLGWLPLLLATLILSIACQSDELRMLLRSSGSIAAGWTALVVLYFTKSPQRLKLGTFNFIWILLIGTGLSLLTVKSFSAGMTGWMLLISIGCARLLSRRTAPTHLFESADRDMPFGPNKPLNGDGVLRYLLHRSAKYSLPLFIFIAFSSFFMGSGYMGFNMFMYFPWVIQPHDGMSWAKHLPIPIQRVAFWSIMPSAFGLLGGLYLGDALSRHFQPTFKEEITLVSRYDDVELSCPGALQDWSFSPKPLRVVSPSGETANIRPWQLPGNLPIYAVNPYGLDQDSSPDFAAWQLSRAAQAYYGTSVPPEVIRERYISLDNDRPEAPSFSKQFAADYEPKAPLKRRSIFWTLSLPVILVWYLIQRLSMDGNRPPAETYSGWLRRIRIRVGVYSVLVICLLILLSKMISFPFELFLGEAPLSTFAFVLHKELPILSALLPPLLLLYIWICWRDLLKHFQRQEFPSNTPEPWPRFISKSRYGSGTSL